MIEGMEGGASPRRWAILKPAATGALAMPEIIAAMEAGVAGGIVDEDFARDVEEGIARHSETWNPPEKHAQAGMRRGWFLVLRCAAHPLRSFP